MTPRAEEARLRFQSARAAIVSRAMFQLDRTRLSCIFDRRVPDPRARTHDVMNRLRATGITALRVTLYGLSIER